MSSILSVPQQNTTRMDRWITLVQQGKQTHLFDEFISPTFIDHGADEDHDREFGRAMLTHFAKTIDDFKVEVVSCVAQGDLVATNKIFTGTLNSDSEFLHAKKGEKLNVRVMDFVRFEEGMFVEHWAVTQPLGTKASR